MLNPPQDPRELRNRLTYPKNNFFAYRWRVVDNFSNSIDREMFHMQINGACQDRSLINERFLALYKRGYSKSRSNLISKMAKEAIAFLEGRRHEACRAADEDAAYYKSMHEKVEHVFGILLSFSIELNTVLGLSELFIAATEPDLMQQSSLAASKSAHAQARFSTTLFSLVVHGQRDFICFYLMPVEDLIGMMDITLEHRPIAVWQAECNSEQEIVWKIDGLDDSDEVTEFACAEILNMLLECTKNLLQPPEQVEAARAPSSISAPDPWEVMLQACRDKQASAEGARFEPVNSADQDGYRMLDQNLRMELPAHLQVQFRMEYGESLPERQLELKPEDLWGPDPVYSFALDEEENLDSLFPVPAGVVIDMQPKSMVQPEAQLQNEALNMVLPAATVQPVKKTKAKSRASKNAKSRRRRRK